MSDKLTVEGLLRNELEGFRYTRVNILTDDLREILDTISSLREKLADLASAGALRPEQTFRIAHDDFVGNPIGSYVTREGKRGVVLQQVGTRVVHVYGEKWLHPEKEATQDDRPHVGRRRSR